MSRWRIPIQRWVSATRQDGIWWIEDPPSLCIAESLHRSNRIVCIHHRDPCFSSCGVRREDPYEYGREVEGVTLDTMHCPFEAQGEIKLRWSIDGYMLFGVERVVVECLTPRRCTMKTVTQTDRPGHYRSREESFSGPGVASFDRILAHPGGPWSAIEITVHASGSPVEGDSVRVTLSGAAVIGGAWTPIPKDERVRWHDRVHGFQPNRRTQDLERERLEREQR